MFHFNFDYMNAPAVVVPPGLPSRKLEQPLWHQITVLPTNQGIYVGSIEFFNTNAILNQNCNVMGSLPARNFFYCKKIALSSSNTQDFYNLINESYFTFTVGPRDILSGPANMLLQGNVKDFNRLVSSLKKLPKSLQESLIRSMKLVDGKHFENQIEIWDLVPIKLRLNTPKAVKLKKPVTLTCTLDGFRLVPLLA